MVPLIIRQTEWASIGVFADEPPGLLAGLAASQGLWDTLLPEPVPGHRDKFRIGIPYEGGMLALYAKAKFPAGSTASEALAACREVSEAAEGYNPQFRESFRTAVMWDMRRSSVVNEITVSRLAAERYLERFGESLPIERSVGFVADRTGRKWGLYELFIDLIGRGDLSDVVRAGFIRAGMRVHIREMAETMAERLRAVGIVSSDIMNEENIVIRGEAGKPESLSLTLVDTEDWMAV